MVQLAAGSTDYDLKRRLRDALFAAEGELALDLPVDTRPAEAGEPGA